LNDAIPSIAFGSGPALTLGVEDELIAVDPATHALTHTGIDLLERIQVPPGAGEAKPDTYAALIELASPVSASAPEAVRALDGLRAAARAAGGTLLGAGLHPDGAFGDVVHAPQERYARISAQVRGLLARTPTCAAHVHVGMPDAETAIRVCNGLREHLPLLQALAANSPFWHGRDSGLASARAQMFRGFPRSEIPRAFEDFEDYADTVRAVVGTGGVTDYTFLWWDIRPHPILGTVEVRAMDAQAPLWSLAALAALVHGLAAAAAHDRSPAPRTPREALMEASFIAARDGLGARLPAADGGLRPVPELTASALERARPHARETGADAALAGIERILREGNGADRQRAAFARGGMPAMLGLLARETGAAYT